MVCCSWFAAAKLPRWRLLERGTCSRASSPASSAWCLTQLTPTRPIITTLIGIIRTRMVTVPRKLLGMQHRLKSRSRGAKTSPDITTTIRKLFREDPLRFLVTGGAGFIGSHLAERLLDRGDRLV